MDPVRICVTFISLVLPSCFVLGWGTQARAWPNIAPFVKKALEKTRAFKEAIRAAGNRAREEINGLNEVFIKLREDLNKVNLDLLSGKKGIDGTFHF